jgi:hypothetical protein
MFFFWQIKRKNRDNFHVLKRISLTRKIKESSLNFAHPKHSSGMVTSTSTAMVPVTGDFRTVRSMKSPTTSTLAGAWNASDGAGSGVAIGTEAAEEEAAATKRAC